MTLASTEETREAPGPRLVRTQLVSALIAALAAMPLASSSGAAMASTFQAQPVAPQRTADATSKDANPKTTSDAVQTVEVKGSSTDYDPRRDDTASKTVLTAAEIRKYGDDNIYDVLKRAPGVTVSGKSIRMRGLANGYTQILVNGDRPPPGFSFDALTPDQIERIEIIAAGSAEFSMQAIAGTINIVLRKVTAKPQRTLRLAASRSRDGHDANAGGTWGDKTGNVSYFLNGTVFQGHGDSESWGMDSLDAPTGETVQSRVKRTMSAGTHRGAFLFPRLSWKPDAADELNLSGILQASRSASHGISHNDNLVGSFPAPDYVDDVQDTPSRQRLNKLDANWIGKVGGGKLDMTLSVERSRYGNDALNDYDTADRTLQLRRDWNTDTRSQRHALRGKFTRSLFDGHEFGAGVDASSERGDETDDRLDQLDQLGAAAPTRTIETFASRITRLAGWAQDEWSVTKQWSMYAGLRWEGVQTDSQTSDLPETHSRNHVLSPVAQTLYKFPDGSGRQLRLAYTRTYRAPNIAQLTARRVEAPLNTRFTPDSGGNPDLKPELAGGIDLTYAQYFKDGAMVSASAARRAITDAILTQLDLDADGRWIYRPVNDGDATVQSLQLEAKLPGERLAAAAKGLQLRASYGRNWSHVSSTPGPGNRLDGQTPASGTLGFDYAAGRITTGASLAWQQGGWVRLSQAQYQNMPSRRDVDAYLLFKPSASYQIRLSGLNLLGQGYTSDSYYEDASGTSRSQSFQRGPRRLSVNLEVKL